MSKQTKFEACLLIDKERRQLFPFSSHGFHVATKPAQRVVADNHGAFFFFSDGSTQRIEKVSEISGARWSRLAWLLGSPRDIDVVFNEYSIDLEELKAIIRDLVMIYREHYLDDNETWLLAKMPPEQINERLLNASSREELFQLLQLPSPDDCLDLL